MTSASEANEADGNSDSGEQINWWRVLAHVAAFCAAAAIGGFLVYPSYPRFQEETETAGEAFGAFLTCCVIVGGFGPMTLLGLFGATRWQCA
jgi:hypothetical protein